MINTPEPPGDIEAMIAETERRLVALDEERTALLFRLGSLRHQRS